MLLKYGGRRHLSDVLRADTGYAALDERDAGLAHELVYGTVRRQAALDAVLRAFATPPLERVEPAALWALRLGAYQLLYLTRVPAHAAVGESVALVRRKHAGALVNAVLRRVAADGATRLAALTAGDDAESLALRFSAPQWLVERWTAEWGHQRTLGLLAALDEPAERCLRVNRLRATVAEARDALAVGGVATRPAAGVHDQGWPDALLVSSGTPERTSAFRRGMVTPQSRASQLVCQTTVGRSTPARIIDMCAAPGIKTTHLAALFPRAAILAVDVDAERAREIGRMTARLHAGAVDVSVRDARGLSAGLDATADLVLLDAPCTGLGTLARQPDLRWRARAHDAARMAALQRELLARAGRLLRPGGLLVYSVCTLTPEETVAAVSGAVATGGLEQDDLGSSYPGLRDPRQGGSLLVMPDRDQTTGFFIAHLRRPVESRSRPPIGTNRYNEGRRAAAETGGEGPGRAQAQATTRKDLS